MKYTEGSRGMRLEGIQRTDIKYRNLAGRATNSKYSDPSNPQHVFVVWIDDEEIVEALKEVGFNVREDEDTFNDLGMRHYLQFKAYPKMRMNRVTGQDEQVPKVVMITGGTNRQLMKSEFGFVDGAHVEKIDIAFHDYEYEKGKHVAALDQLWCSVDETAGGQNDTYFEEKYGHLRDLEPDEEEGEVPFR